METDSARISVVSEFVKTIRSHRVVFLFCEVYQLPQGQEGVTDADDALVVETPGYWMYGTLY